MQKIIFGIALLAMTSSCQRDRVPTEASPAAISTPTPTPFDPAGELPIPVAKDLTAKVSYTQIETPVLASLGQGVVSAIVQSDRNGYDQALVLDPVCMIGDISVKTATPDRETRHAYGPSHLPGTTDEAKKLARLRVARELDPWGFLATGDVDFPADFPSKLVDFASEVLTYDSALALSFTTTDVVKSLTVHNLENSKRSEDQNLQCGDAFVSAIHYGAALQTVMTATFQSRDDRDAFQLEFGFNSPFAYDVQDAGPMAQRLADLSAKIDIKVGMVGGPLAVVGALVNSSVCTTDKLEACLATRRDIEKAFADSLKEAPALAPMPGQETGWVPVAIGVLAYPD